MTTTAPSESRRPCRRRRGRTRRLSIAGAHRLSPSVPESPVAADVKTRNHDESCERPTGTRPHARPPPLLHAETGRAESSVAPPDSAATRLRGSTASCVREMRAGRQWAASRHDATADSTAPIRGEPNAQAFSRDPAGAQATPRLGPSLAAVLDQGKSVAAAERSLEPGHASLQPWASGAVSVPQAAAAKSRLTTTCVGRP
jgi:hypothetical protein